MADTPSIYINASTPGFTTARINPGGDVFDVIFDEAFEETANRPGIICAEADAAGIQSRDTVLAIKTPGTGDEKFYRVMGRPYLDRMGLATISLQEE